MKTSQETKIRQLFSLDFQYDNFTHHSDLYKLLKYALIAVYCDPFILQKTQTFLQLGA